jgi:TolB protein
MLTRALLCAACALAVTATPALATFPGQNGKIVFTHFVDGNDESTADIYTVSPNGRHLRNLTPDSPAADDAPSWSADGRMIAFWSTRRGPGNPTGDQEIFVMNANGSGLRQVTKNKVDDGGPAWSPNGDRLVFHRFPGDGTGADLFTVRVNGRGERNLTRSPGIGDLHGVWSPDGREILFMRDDSGSENDIATIRPDGSNLQTLTATDTDEEGPDWSPDGKRIVFQWNAPAHAEDYEVYVMLRDGSSLPTRLTMTEGFTPVWSPDGRQILFSNNPRPRRRGDVPQLFTMGADGSSQKRVRPGFDGHHPDWQPVRKAARR